MPGHKLGKGIPKKFLQDMHRLDLTEIPGVDNLHFPQGPIKQALELASQAFGADETFFLVNGSTVGILSTILTICNRGEKLIVSRNCHKSIINAMILGGITPVYIKPEYDPNFGISTVINLETLDDVLRKNSDAKGVIITRPNYYGICSDILKISELVHKYNMILAVDEAHGAHFRFNNKLPICAMDGGADICVQSAHKTLPALTQSAYLHVKGNRVDIDKLKFNLRMLQTTSPSYLFMSYLDIARALMVEYGESELNKTISNCEWVKSTLSSNQGLTFLSESNLKLGNMDKTRLVINVEKLGLTGYEVDNILREKHNIQVEMADLYNIVCICTVSDEFDYYQKLAQALRELPTKLNLNSFLADKFNVELDLPEQKLDFSEVYSTKSEKMNLKQAIGMISKESITPYPPGIPIVCPGEVIGSDIVEQIIEILEVGGEVNGVDKNLNINVISLK